MKKKTIKVVYHDDVEPIKVLEVGNWIDLRASQTVELREGDYKMIPLGVSMELPEGYEAIVAPRSSTFKNYGILLTNGIGIIDESYCGNDDIWQFPAYATRDTTIRKNDRICQFRIIKHQPHLEFDEVMFLENDNRGGLGSTGIK